MAEIKMMKKREPLVEGLNIPMATSQVQRYKKVAYELDNRNLTKLHDLTRERIDSLLNEVESELSKSS